MRFVARGLGSKERFFIDDKQVSKEEYDQALAATTARLPQIDADAAVAGNRPWTRPILSEALAVHPEQIGEAMERNAAHGLHVDYDRPSGRPILRSRQERNQLCQIEGVHDKDGGYGDRHY